MINIDETSNMPNTNVPVQSKEIERCDTPEKKSKQSDTSKIKKLATPKKKKLSTPEKKKL